MYALKMNTTDGSIFNKVHAIKGFRMMSDMGLKESKEFVERVIDAHPNPLYEDFTTIKDSARARNGEQMLVEGGISIINVGDPRRGKILDGLRTLTEQAVNLSQYDLAGQLLKILQFEDF